MYANMKRKPATSITVQVSLGGQEDMHPRMANMVCKIENALAYLEEHGSGGDHSQDDLDFLEKVYHALKRCPEGHPIKVHFCEPIKTVLSKYRSDAIKEEQPDGENHPVG